MLKSQYETRVIDVMINVQELEHTYSLGFCCKARQNVVQQIPLLNSADKAIAILAEVRSQKGGGHLQVNLTLVF